jgi:hypothetical protein
MSDELPHHAFTEKTIGIMVEKVRLRKAIWIL